MERKDNILRRIGGIFSNSKETFKNICRSPTSWKFIFLLLVGIMTISIVYVVQMPSGLTSIIIAASTFPVYMIYLLFFAFMVIFSLIYLFILNFVYIIGKRLRNSKKEHRNKKVIFNIYIYSLVPLLLLTSQIPFFLIFGGYYSLMQLKFFFYFLLGLCIGWHVTLLYQGIRAESDISSGRAKLVAGLYIGIISFTAGFVIFAILYLPFSISWLGSLF